MENREFEDKLVSKIKSTLTNKSVHIEVINPNWDGFVKFQASRKPFYLRKGFVMKVAALTVISVLVGIIIFDSPTSETPLADAESQFERFPADTDFAEAEVVPVPTDILSSSSQEQGEGIKQLVPQGSAEEQTALSKSIEGDINDSLSDVLTESIADEKVLVEVSDSGSSLPIDLIRPNPEVFTSPGIVNPPLSLLPGNFGKNDFDGYSTKGRGSSDKAVAGRTYEDRETQERDSNKSVSPWSIVASYAPNSSLEDEFFVGSLGVNYEKEVYPKFLLSLGANFYYYKSMDHVLNEFNNRSYEYLDDDTFHALEFPLWMQLKLFTQSSMDLRLVGGVNFAYTLLRKDIYEATSYSDVENQVLDSEIRYLNYIKLDKFLISGVEAGLSARLKRWKTKELSLAATYVLTNSTLIEKNHFRIRLGLSL